MRHNRLSLCWLRCVTSPWNVELKIIDVERIDVVVKSLEHTTDYVARKVLIAINALLSHCEFNISVEVPCHIEEILTLMILGNDLECVFLKCRNNSLNVNAWSKVHLKVFEFFKLPLVNFGILQEVAAPHNHQALINLCID